MLCRTSEPFELFRESLQDMRFDFGQVGYWPEAPHIPAKPAREAAREISYTYRMDSQRAAGQGEAKAQQNPQPQAPPMGAWGRP